MLEYTQAPGSNTNPNLDKQDVISYISVSTSTHMGKDQEP